MLSVLAWQTFSCIYGAFGSSSFFTLFFTYLLPYEQTRIHSFLSLLTDCFPTDYDRPTDRQTDRQHSDFPSKRGRTLPHIIWHSTWGRRQALQIRSLEDQAAERQQQHQTRSRASRLSRPNEQHPHSRRSRTSKRPRKLELERDGSGDRCQDLRKSPHDQ